MFMLSLLTKKKINSFNLAKQKKNKIMRKIGKQIFIQAQHNARDDDEE